MTLVWTSWNDKVDPFPLGLAPMACERWAEATRWGSLPLTDLALVLPLSLSLSLTYSLSLTHSLSQAGTNPTSEWANGN